MNKYEELLRKATKAGINVTEKDMKSKGYYGDNEIWISSRLSTSEKASILAEEIGHHLTSFGDIIEQTKINNIKQEHTARAYGYEHFITPEELRKALDAGCIYLHELAEYVGFSEDFCKRALDHYQSKYGPGYIVPTFQYVNGTGKSYINLNMLGLLLNFVD